MSSPHPQEARTMLKPIQPPALANQMQPAPLMPHRLSQMEADSVQHSKAQMLTSPTLGTMVGAQAASKASEEEHEAAQQEAMMQIMIAALKSPEGAPTSGGDQDQSPTAMHARTPFSEQTQPTAAASSPPAAAATRNGDDAHSEGDDDDEGVEVEQKLFGKKSPSADGDGKGAGSSSSPAAQTPEAARKAAAVEHARVVQQVLAALNNTDHRAYAFGPEDEAILAEAIKSKACEAEKAQLQPADKDKLLQRAATHAAAPISEREIVSYLLHAPLLYADSESIAPPETKAPLPSSTSQAGRVYQQAIQALFLHNTTADFKRVETPADKEARRKREAKREAKAAAAVKKKQQQQQRQQQQAEGSPSPCASDSESSDDEDELPPPPLSSLTFDAVMAAAMDKSAPQPLSPLDSKHPSLRPLLLALEAAFDVPDRVTKKASAPFRHTVRHNLLLAQSLARLHQARLDSHPFYQPQRLSSALSSSAADAADSEGPGSGFPTPALYGVWYTHENAHLNRQLNDLADMQAFESKHPRTEEVEARKRHLAEQKERERNEQKKPSLIAAGTSGGSGAEAGGGAGAAAKPKQKKGGFFSCCCSAAEEPEIEQEARMQPKPSDAGAIAAAPLPSSPDDDDAAEDQAEDRPDESIVSSWAGENFHANYLLLLQVLMQYETNLEAEIDREEAAQRLKEKSKKKASEINVDELVHPDEMEARAEKEKAAAAEASKLSTKTSEDEEEQQLASIHTSRTLNGCRIRALSAQSLKLLRIYASTFRVGMPFASTSSLELLASNLNFNAPEYYSAVTNELTIAQALYRSHLLLASGSLHAEHTPVVGGKAAAELIIPFTDYELDSLRDSVQSLWEWVALSLSRYQLVFAKTVEAVERKGGAPAQQSKVAKHDADEHGDEIPSDDDADEDIEADEWHDGLRECLYLFLKLRELMEELALPLHISPRDMSRAIAAAAVSPPPSPPMRIETGEEPESSAAQPVNAAPQPVELLRSLIEPALTRRYQQLLELCVPSDLTPAATAASAMPVAASSATPSPSLDAIRHVSHMTALLQAVSAELLLDQERSSVFQEVVKESDIEVRRREGNNPAAVSTPAAAAASSPATAASSGTTPPVSPMHRPSVAALADPHSHRDGFHLSKIASATYLSFVWSDVQQFLLELRLQQGDLLKLPKHNKSQAAALQAIDAQIDGIVRSYAKFKDLYALVARHVQNLPDLRSRVQSWFDWAIASWISRTQSDWTQGAANKVSALIAADTFAIDLGSTRVRYSSSFVGLFAFLQPLAHAFKSMPFSQRNAEDFAVLLSSVITTYVSFVHDDVARVLDQERMKKILWGTTITPDKESSVVLSLPPSLFVRANNILLCKSQLQLLLDELALPAKWRELLGDAMPVSPRARGSTAAPNGLRSPAEQHSAQSPVLGAAELPNAEEKQSSPSRLARHPVTSPLSPGPAAASALPLEASPLPPSVLNTLECRRAIDWISQCADDLVLRMTAGLGSFIELHAHTVIWKDVGGEWSGRHTKEESEPLLSYLSKHFDHLRCYLYDWLFVRLCFFLLSDFIVLLEKEMVHPAKQHWAHRLRTEQVHRVIQLHYLITDFFETEYRLPAEYVQRVRESHLKRLEYLETLLTGGSDDLVAAFHSIPAAQDEAEHTKLSFTEREVLRLSRPPYLTRRQVAGILKFRAEEEGDHSVTGFLKEHKQGLFAANFFQ